MFSVDLKKSLSAGLTKEKLMEQFATAIDTATAQVIEETQRQLEIDNRRKSIAIAIHDGLEYTADDLIFLQRLLNNKKRGTKTATTWAPFSNGCSDVTATDNKKKSPATSTSASKTISEEELTRIMDSLVGSIVAPYSTTGKGF